MRYSCNFFISGFTHGASSPVEQYRKYGVSILINALSKEEGGYRNTTYCYDREGVLRGKYFKKHLPPLEVETLALDFLVFF